jgi:hypothetical protein
MTRIELINSLIKRNGYTTYLEIGVNTPAQPGFSHDSIEIETKHGVDPAVDTTFRMTSDDFFAQNKNTYDIVFVDGLHIFEQAHRDIEHALLVLNEGGIIVVHDCNPIREITQRRERASSVWHGDVWKAILKLRMERRDIKLYTVRTDEGRTARQRYVDRDSTIQREEAGRAGPHGPRLGEGDGHGVEETVGARR